MKYCEYCNSKHDGSFASGRFCSKKCSAGFSTRDKRKIINKKVSQKLKKEKVKAPESLKQLSSRTMIKVLKRMKLSCFSCGWYHPQAVCDVHHIIPKALGGGDNDSNLTYICPNCHRLVHSGVDMELFSVAEKIGDSWREYFWKR